MKIPFTLMEKLKCKERVFVTFTGFKSRKTQNQKPGKNGIEWTTKSMSLGKQARNQTLWASKTESFEEEGR